MKILTGLKEVQQMILADDLARMDWNSNMKFARKEGKAEGRAEGKAEGKAEGLAEGKTEAVTEIVDLNKWLISKGRQDDIIRYTEDPSYLDNLLSEFHTAEHNA